MNGRRPESAAILLVEDSADDQALALRALDRLGIANEVLLAQDGAEAVAVLLRRADEGLLPPALILLDLKLPKLGGIDVLKRIRADMRTRYVPVVILTSSAEEEDIRAGYEHGANAYVRKPVKFAEFVGAVSAVGAFWLKFNQVAPVPGAVAAPGGAM